MYVRGVVVRMEQFKDELLFASITMVIYVYQHPYVTILPTQ